MRRLLARVSLVTAVAAASTMGPVSLASASTGATFHGCPERSLCGWSEPYFQGEMTTWEAGRGCFNTPFPIRSAANTWKGGIDVVLYLLPGKDCEGEYDTSVTRSESRPFLPIAALSVDSVW
ncbi:hypothetical protein BZB76_4718 [Actinomadura pelletieri DSM 43383]|uniref:Peptidase inhibitor family I36 n=2 Tax=Actinomadura pelletieri TaxID=111805 RepID=A0A495QIE0_9ACTN|nr:hypothetical protein BZB76_4718 [Actinomadura pelletieri DSM 43383]